MTIQQLYEQLAQRLTPIGEQLNLPDTSTLPLWNTLVFQVVRLQINIENQEANKYAERLTDIKNFIPQAKAEVSPWLPGNGDLLFAEIEASAHQFSQWIEENIEQEKIQNRSNR